MNKNDTMYLKEGSSERALKCDATLASGPGAYIESATFSKTGEMYMLGFCSGQGLDGTDPVTGGIKTYANLWTDSKVFKN